MRIAGVNIPDNKKIEYAIAYIYGIGFPVAQKIIKQAQVDKNKRAKELSADEVNRIREIVEHSFKIEGDLRREIS